MMDALQQQKIQIMIDMATKKLQLEVQQLRDQVSNLKDEVINIRSQRNTGAIQSGSPQTKLQETTERPPINQPIDRTGIAPSEVSIEKMFYCGNKRF